MSIYEISIYIGAFVTVVIVLNGLARAGHKKKAKAIEAHREQIIKGDERVFFAKDGQAWNPVRKFPRNEPCYCGSGLKFKKCCLLSLFAVVPPEVASKASRAVKIAREERRDR